MTTAAAPEWVVLTKPSCLFSKQCVELLRKLHLPFEERPGPALERLPRVYRDGRCIGGWTQLREKLTEPLLMENPGRFSPFPLQYPDLWEMYKQAVACFWTVEEVNFSRDRADWKGLTADERHFVSHVLAFFASSDGIVQENLCMNFCTEVQVAEARSFYAAQGFFESIHNECYSLLIDTYITDPAERANIFRAITTVPCVRKKAEWAIKWLDPQRPFAQRLLAFICVEGILFSGSFCAIFWLKKRNLLPGLTFSNELISRDEALHQIFGETLYGYLQTPLSQDMAQAIVREAVDNEVEFITEALPCRLIGMNAQLMQQYVQFVADRILATLEYDRLYDVEQPFDFMENISLSGKTNFFEREVSEYKRAHVGQTEEDKEFGLEDNF